MQVSIGERFCEELLGWKLPDRLPDSRAELEALAARLGSSRLALELIRGRIAFDPERYARIRLHRDAAWELLLLCWLPGQASTVHDHEGSSGAVRLLAGNLVETRFDRVGRVLAERAVGAPQVLLEYPETVHRVCNAGDAPALSLHLYGPPLREGT